MNHWFSDNEVKFLRSILPKDDIVFSHNDLLANNILLIPPVIIISYHQLELQ